jgi:hypothetical protein
VDVDGSEPIGCPNGIHLAASVIVEVDMGLASSWGRSPERSWLVRLGRGDRWVVVAIGLSRVATVHLAEAIRELLAPVAFERARSPGR